MTPYETPTERKSRHRLNILTAGVILYAVSLATAAAVFLAVYPGVAPIK